MVITEPLFRYSSGVRVVHGVDNVSVTRAFEGRKGKHKAQECHPFEDPSPPLYEDGDDDCGDERPPGGDAPPPHVSIEMTVAVMATVIRRTEDDGLQKDEEEHTSPPPPPTPRIPR